MRKSKYGKITVQVGAYPLKSELEVANIFASLGKDIEFLAPNKGYKVKTADFWMDGKQWEVKCPETEKRDKIRGSIREGSGQSPDIIFATFCIKMPDERLLPLVKKYASESHRIKSVIVVTKHKVIIDIPIVKRYNRKQGRPRG